MRPRTVLAVAIAAHLALGAALAAGELRPFFNDLRNRPGPAADFFAVYHAGRQVWTGRSPYEPAERPRITPPYFAPFRYPPGVAWTLGAAAARLRPWVAYGAWIAVLEGLLVLGVVRLREVIADPVRLAWVRAGWLAFPPYLVELWMGQFTFVAAMLVFLAVLSWKRDQPRRAAVMWAAACALKIFPLALVPALALRRRWGALATAAAALAAALAPLLALDGGVRGFFRLNFGAPDPAEVHAGNFSLAVLVHRVVEPDPDTYAWIARALALALVAAAVAIMWRERRAPLGLSAAVALWLLPLMSKDAWEHHYVIALPAVAFMVEAYADRPRLLAGTAVAWTLVAAPSLLALLQDEPSTWYPDASWSRATRVAYHAMKPLGALLGVVLSSGRWSTSPATSRRNSGTSTDAGRTSTSPPAPADPSSTGSSRPTPE